MSNENDPMLRLVTELVTAPDDLPPQVFEDGVAALRRYLQRRYSPPLAGTEIDELAADAVLQLFDAACRGLIDNADNPTGYLLKIAVNNARAAIRRTLPTVTVDDLAGSLLTDDQAAARLDQVATADLIRQAVGRARRQGDVTAVQAAVYLLDQAQLTGVVPSSRQAAQALGLSHAGVAKAVRRLRGYLTEADSG